MQTGNTILITVRTVGSKGAPMMRLLLKSLAAMTAYNLGAIVFNLIHGKGDGERGDSGGNRRATRWKMMASFALQMLCIATAAALAQGRVVTNRSVVGTSAWEMEPSQYIDLLPIALLAFEAAGQVTLSRVLSFADLPTIVISTIYHDLAADSLHGSKDWKDAKAQPNSSIEEKEGKRSSFWSRLMKVNGGRQERQMQRTICVMCLGAGAAIGANLAAKRRGAASALWVAVGIKTGLLIAVCFWPAEGNGENGGGDEERGSPV